MAMGRTRGTPEGGQETIVTFDTGSISITSQDVTPHVMPDKRFDELAEFVLALIKIHLELLPPRKLKRWIPFVMDLLRAEANRTERKESIDERRLAMLERGMSEEDIGEQTEVDIDVVKRSIRRGRRKREAHLLKRQKKQERIAQLEALLHAADLPISCSS
jgi:hypothetical protein